MNRELPKMQQLFFFFYTFILAHFVLFMFVHWSVCKLPGEGARLPFQIGLEA